MALRVLNPGVMPIGQFDGLDSITSTIKGGEVGSIVGVALGASVDKAAKDTDGSDGYVGNASITIKRPVVTTNLVSGNRPLFLLDDGIAYYGTLFGQVVGGAVGQQSTGGALLGPHTATASGKITCWDKEGLYAVTLDAVDTTATTGLMPTNTTLNIGDPLYATSAGLLTPRSAGSFEASLKVARFIEFTTERSLVTTPAYLVSALNSPVGVSSVQLLAFTQAMIYFSPTVA